MMICPKCKKEILDTELKYMLALERPYLNVYMHRTCYDEVCSSSLMSFVFDNIGLLLEMWNTKSKR